MINNNPIINELTYVTKRLNSIDLDLGYLIPKLDASESAILEDIISTLQQANNRVKCLTAGIDKTNVHTNTSDIDLPSTQEAWCD